MAKAFDWVRTVPTTRRGWINAIDATGAGVLVAGADVDAEGNSTPFVAALDPTGRELYRSAISVSSSSNTTPSRTVAVAVKGTEIGSYALIAGARMEGPASSQLVALDHAGKQIWSKTLDFNAQAASKLATNGSADIVIAGAAQSRDTIGVGRFASNGKPIWSVQFHYQGEVPFVLPEGDRTLLVGELSGTAQFGAQRVGQVGNVAYRCAGQMTDCTRPARGLVAVELDASGAPTLVKHYGSPSSLLSVSSAVASGDGQITIAGEFMGEPTHVGDQQLCEISDGMPEPEPLPFPESSAANPCGCTQSKRNLYALRLNRKLEVRWARTLTLGSSEPQVTTDAQGRTYWSNVPSPIAGDTVNGTVVQGLGRSGFLGPGWVVDSPSSHLAAASDGTLYLGDRRQLKRLTNRSR